uniref:Cell cycle checkpoint control protein n=1 Tax=Glossina morsitans morsitans TaxID=37546 RepID=A0A1B0G8K3_GLOMM
MKCSLSGTNAKTVAKSIQSLAKFGSELYIEADAQGLQLRSFNSSKSAMGTFRFKRTFFESYNVLEDNENYCKIGMKAALAIFKNMQQVERCNICILPEPAKLQIQFSCRLETLKNALIAIVDEENISTPVSIEEANNLLVGSYKIFNDISNNFNTAEAEITLEVNSNGLTAKNYIEGSRVNDRFMRSQLKLSPVEFESYNIAQETAITFSLKEFRSFLSFAESLGENISLHFDQAGDPIIMTIKKIDLIECNLIMSTLYSDDVSIYEELREKEVNERMSVTVKTPASNKRKHSDSERTTKTQTPKRALSEVYSLTNGTALFQFDNGKGSSDSSTNYARNCTQPDVQKNDHNEHLLLSAEGLALREENSVAFENFEIARNMASQEKDGEDEVIAQSPQRTETSKLRRVFTRCFENTYVLKEPSPNSQVYVPNSDAED